MRVLCRLSQLSFDLNDCDCCTAEYGSEWNLGCLGVRSSGLIPEFDLSCLTDQLSEPFPECSGKKNSFSALSHRWKRPCYRWAEQLHAAASCPRVPRTQLEKAWCSPVAILFFCQNAITCYILIICARVNMESCQMFFVWADMSPYGVRESVCLWEGGVPKLWHFPPQMKSFSLHYSVMA